MEVEPPLPPSCIKHLGHIPLHRLGSGHITLYQPQLFYADLCQKNGTCLVDLCLGTILSDIIKVHKRILNFKIIKY